MHKDWKLDSNGNGELKIGPFLLNINSYGIMGELVNKSEFDFEWRYPGTVNEKCEEAQANLKRTLLAVLKELG